MLKKTSLFGLVAAGALVAGVVGFVGCAQTPDNNAAVTCAIPGDVTKLTAKCAAGTATTCEIGTDTSASVCTLSGTTCALDPTKLTAGCVSADFGTFGTCAATNLAAAGQDSGVACSYTLTAPSANP
jgi:hypothetical protein